MFHPLRALLVACALVVSSLANAAPNESACSCLATTLFGRKDAGDRAGPGFGIRIDPLALRHEQEDRAQLRGLHTPCDFIAAITQHIPDKSFQLVRYYGWYSNKMRGGLAKQADEEAQAEGDAVEVIDVSAHEPRRIPSKKWREFIKKVWEADPLRCLKCSREMRIVSLIDEEDVIERILRHLGLWQEGRCVHSGTDPPGETTLDPWLDDPFPDYDTEPVVAFSAT
jgi:Putative transposase